MRTQPLDELTEKQWQQQVVDLANATGWHRPYHTHDSRRSEPGWPDLALVRERFLLVELKREKGHVSDAQRTWITRLLNAGLEVYIARPRDLELLALILSTRYAPASSNQKARAAAEALALRTNEELH